MKYLLISIVCVFYVCYSDGWRYARNDVIRGNIGVQHRIGVLHATSKGFASTPSSSSNHAKPVLQSHEDCVCQSKLKFGDCCGQVYVNRGLPFSATATTTTRQEDTTVENTTMSAIERLIRSRYTAYFLKHADYLIATTHPANKVILSLSRPSLWWY